MPTKPKPRWLDLRWLAAGLCALLLALPVQAAEGRTAASQKSTNKASAAKAGQTRVKSSRKSTRQRVPQKATAQVVAMADQGIGLFGAASYYGSGFHGRLTASGERFDKYDMTAASNRFPLGTWVAVRRESDGRCVIVRINDRMHPRHRTRIIDLSRGAAEQLRMISAGVVMVRVAPLPGAPDGDAKTVCEQTFFADSVNSCPDCEDATSPLPETSELAEGASP